MALYQITARSVRSLARTSSAVVQTSQYVTVIPRGPAQVSPTFDCESYDAYGSGPIIRSQPAPHALCVSGGLPTFVQPVKATLSKRKSPNPPFHGLSGAPLVRDASDFRTETASTGATLATSSSGSAHGAILSLDLTADLYGEDFKPGCWLP